MTKSMNSSNYVFTILVLFACASQLFAAEPRPLSAKAQAMAEKRQQFEQEAAAAIPEIEAEYAKFVAYVNSGRTPDDANIRQGAKFITRNKRYLPILTKQHNGGTYNALSSWVFYFDKKHDKAQKQIASGIKDSPSNLDFVRSAVALSMVYKDYNSVSQVLAPFTEIAEAAEVSAPQEQSYSQMPENVLHFDVNSIRTDLLGKVAPLPSDRNILFVLLWKIDPTELDKFAPTEPKPPVDPNNPQPQEQEQPIELSLSELVPMPELTAFAKLQNQFSKEPHTAFMSINLNPSSKAKNVENWISKNPHSLKLSASSSQMQQAVSAVFGQTPAKSVLLITGPDSTVRYVGDVNCFLPAMIAQSILDNPQEFNEPNIPTPGEPNIPMPMTSQIIAEPQQSQDSAPVTESNTPVGQTSESVQPQTSSVKTKVTVQDSENSANADFTEVDYQAQKDLEYAKTLFKVGNRLQYHTYAKPIELCRNIIAKYPDTKYAEEARVLMRQVPERFRARYNITDEELGL